MLQCYTPSSKYLENARWIVITQEAVRPGPGRCLLLRWQEREGWAPKQTTLAQVQVDWRKNHKCRVGQDTQDARVGSMWQNRPHNGVPTKLCSTCHSRWKKWCYVQEFEYSFPGWYAFVYAWPKSLGSNKIHTKITENVPNKSAFDVCFIERCSWSKVRYFWWHQQSGGQRKG